MPFCLGNLRNCNLTFLVCLISVALLQISLDNHRQILLRHLLVVRDRYRDVMLLIHVGPIRELDCDVAGLPNGHDRMGNGSSRLCALHFDRQRPTLPIGIFISTCGLAILVGLARAAGHRDLARFVCLSRGIVVIMIGHSNRHRHNRRLVLYQLYCNGCLVRVVQQSATGKADGDRIVLGKADSGIGNRCLRISICNGHQITTHNGLAVAVCRCFVFNLLHGLCV